MFQRNSQQGSAPRSQASVENASARPWRVFTTPDGLKLVGIGDEGGGGILDCGFGVWSWQHAEGIANAELVVKAVNNHEALVEALKDLIEAVRRDSDEGGKGISGYTAARLTDAREVLAALTQANL